MDMKAEFLRIMRTQTDMAIATSVEGQPNVRIVNFYFDDAAGILYFSTFKDNDKVREMSENPHVAFTTVPHEGNEHVKAKGLAKISARSIFDVAERFIEKISDYASTIEYAGDSLIVYEVKFDEALVTLDFEHIETIRL